MKKSAYAIVGMLLLVGISPVVVGSNYVVEKQKTLCCDDPGDVEYWAVCVFGFNESDAALIQHVYMYDAVVDLECYPLDHIRYLGIENATRDTVLDALDWAADMADENDIVLYAHNSHGVRRNGEYGVALYDSSFISVDDFDEKFDAFSCGGLCVVFDSCLSGTFVDRGASSILRRQNQISYDTAFSTGLEGDGRVILMSTLPRGLGFSAKAIDENETMVDVGFSKFVADALLGQGDGNSDGVVSAEETFSYARRKFVPFALLMCFALRQQIMALFQSGFFIKAFPTIADGFEGDLVLTA